VVLFRGLGLDVEQFKRFTDRFGTSERDAHPSLNGETREVLTGNEAQALHAEFRVAPCIAPDLLWFYCLRPAESDGRTTVGDGVRLLAEMTEACRELFVTRKTRFHVVIPNGVWQAVFPTTEGVSATLGRYPELASRFDERNALHVVCIQSAIRRTKFSGEEAFVNPVLHALDYPHYYRLTLEDGQPVPSGVAEELRATARRLTVPIAWQKGDFVMIDNTRVLHGREAFVDPQRRILARHAMASFY
jgi:hypothetical protein